MTMIEPKNTIDNDIFIFLTMIEFKNIIYHDKNDDVI